MERDGGHDGESAEKRPGPRPAGWTLGLPALALLVGALGLAIVPGIEGEIRREANGIVDREGREAGLPRDGVRSEVDGRDVAIVLDQGLPDGVGPRVEERLRAIPGVRTVRLVVAPALPMDPFTFSVSWTRDRIRLEGGVPSPADRTRLVDLAGKEHGSDRVDDRLRLGTGAPPGFTDAAAFLLGALRPVGAGEASLSGPVFAFRATAPDGATYRAVLDALRQPPPGFRPGEVAIVPPLADPFVWTMRLDASGLALAGAVPSEAIRAEILRLASATLPDAPVRDRSETARGLPGGVDLVATARTALAALRRLKVGEAELSGRRLSFRGEGVNKAELPAIETALRDGLPSGTEIGTVAIRAVPAVPFTWTARRGRGGVELAGFVPDEAMRRAAGEVLAMRFPGERVRDVAVVADGAPPGFADAARSALTSLSELAEGEAALSDREMRVTGRGLYGQATARLRRNLPATAPEGWTASGSFEAAEPERPLDAMQCGDLLSDAARSQPIRFESGKPGLAGGPTGDPGFAMAADLVRRCGPRVTIRVVHRIGPVPDASAARELALARAGTITAALAERGATARLVAEADVLPDSGTERTEFRVGSP